MKSEEKSKKQRNGTYFILSVVGLSFLIIFFAVLGQVLGHPELLCVPLIILVLIRNNMGSKIKSEEEKQKWRKENRYCLLIIGIGAVVILLVSQGFGRLLGVAFAVYTIGQLRKDYAKKQ